MSTIRINRTHSLNESGCHEALEDLTAYLQEEFAAKVTRQDGTLSFSGSGFAGEVCVEPGRASGKIKLGLLARPFRRTLENEINRHLDARFGTG
ncbi:conserved hypothetical protein [Luminiphilus syltensis NOR5-1B]|uniref:Polyhydroxyalkanoic acid system protein n=1 Tax=Luminiphilus syltensis NOR5-1B TaxID=565045 RepID=B8KSS1_9GAMM|nr:polyhydroxyalkanoic acid system family protein [Luminiphilus syltensis]EED36263.1 conserved hypothetical protein [Luminiphilus syltensis NOR5-1B]